MRLSLWFGTNDFKRALKLGRESLWLISGQFVAIIGQVVGVKLFTGLLTPSEYGELALGLTVASLANLVIFSPLTNGLLRFFPVAQEKNNLCQYFNAGQKLFTKGSILVLVIGCVGILSLLLVNRQELIGILSIALIFSIFSAWNTVLNGMHNSIRERHVVAFHQGGEPWARICAAICLTLWLGNSSAAVLLGYALGLLPLLLSQYLLFKGKVPIGAQIGEGAGKWEEELVAYSWPFALWGVFFWTQQASDRWALELFGDRKQVGLYAVLLQVGYYPISIFTKMLWQLLSPIFYGRVGDAKSPSRVSAVNDATTKALEFVIFVTLCGVLVAFYCHGLIFRMFVAKEYFHVSYLLPWIILAGGVYSAGQILALNLMSRIKTQSMILPISITSVLGSAFNFIGAKFYGIPGVVAGELAFSVTYLIGMSYVANDIFRQKTNVNAV